MPSIYLCFADRAQARRSDVLGPFDAVDLTYGSVRVTNPEGSEEVIARRDDELALWEYAAGEYPTLLIVDSPSAQSVREIADDC
ncbi:hypothetical protein SAMN05446635_6038 [Burkholderia sp. OK233]|nr:hypothetical protein SAMN05446635_6038 [Burkholderia sp. OK233]